MYFTYVYRFFLHDNKHTYNSLEFKYLYTTLHPELCSPMTLCSQVKWPLIVDCLHVVCKDVLHYWKRFIMIMQIITIATISDFSFISLWRQLDLLTPVHKHWRSIQDSCMPFGLYSALENIPKKKKKDWKKKKNEKNTPATHNAIQCTPTLWQEMSRSQRFQNPRWTHNVMTVGLSGSQISMQSTEIKLQ